MASMVDENYPNPGWIPHGGFYGRNEARTATGRCGKSSDGGVPKCWCLQHGDSWSCLRHVFERRFRVSPFLLDLGHLGNVSEDLETEIPLLFDNMFVRTKTLENMLDNFWQIVFQTARNCLLNVLSFAQRLMVKKANDSRRPLHLQLFYRLHVNIDDASPDQRKFQCRMDLWERNMINNMIQANKCWQMLI